jgi:hypothetical protein
VAAVTLAPADLAPFATIDVAKAQEMIDDALARAARVAPCIRDTALSADNSRTARSIIRDAILRWNDAGSGGIAQQSAGPFQMTVDTRQRRRELFTDADKDELRAICRDHAGVVGGGAFGIDTTPVPETTV